MSLLPSLINKRQDSKTKQYEHHRSGRTAAAAASCRIIFRSSESFYAYVGISIPGLFRQILPFYPVRRDKALACRCVCLFGVVGYRIFDRDRGYIITDPLEAELWEIYPEDLVGAGSAMLTTTANLLYFGISISESRSTVL